MKTLGPFSALMYTALLSPACLHSSWAFFKGFKLLSGLCWVGGLQSFVFFMAAETRKDVADEDG